MTTMAITMTARNANDAGHKSNNTDNNYHDNDNNDLNNDDDDNNKTSNIGDVLSSHVYTCCQPIRVHEQHRSMQMQWP